MAKKRWFHEKRIEHPDQLFIWAGDKELKKLQKTAWEAGWWPSKKKKGIMWMGPNGAQVMVHGTPSDGHAYPNMLGEFRKQGLDA
jgi:hypothetical protein